MRPLPRTTVGVTVTLTMCILASCSSTKGADVRATCASHDSRLRVWPSSNLNPYIIFNL